MSLLNMRIFTALGILLLSACSLNTLSTKNAPSPAAIPKPKNITLLVPLEGSNGGRGQAIRNGFLAAYYYAKQTMPHVPTINVVDTSHGNVATLYHEAVAKGADLIVGPLTKQEVQTLAKQTHLEKPVLALNTLDNLKSVPNLYQFGLSPQNEAEQVAIRAKHDGFSRAVIITPAGSWGNDIAKAFEKKWQALGGTVTNHFAYPPKGDMAVMIQRALGVNKNGSKTKLDVVFLAATPTYARQIKPLLTFYGARNLPVYATSVIYAGIPSGQDHDLDGVILGDMPWIVSPDTPALGQIRANIQTLWANSYNHSPRLYALGIDAYHLTYTFKQLASGGVEGATGKLTLDANQRVRRALDWAKFQNGAPQKMP